MSEKQKSFDLDLVYQCLTKCRKPDGEILIDHYIDGYTELCKFFSLFGTVFSFVVSDVHSKINIIQQHRKSDVGPHYITVSSMVDFEVSNKLTKVKGKLPSGSRTLLRLHRALEFLILFIEKIASAGDEEKLSAIAADAYSQTLAKHHPWVIRKAAGLAMYVLPTREQLLEKMDMEKQTAIDLLEKVPTSAQPVYDTVQQVYQEHGILDLP